MTNTTTINRLHELFILKDDGSLVRKCCVGGKVAGTIAGHRHWDGYDRVKIDQSQFLVHRVVFAMTHGRWPAAGNEVDHINGDRRDNRPTNLREATRAQNQQNRPTPKRNTSGEKGVSWNKVWKKWVAEIRVNGKAIVLGGLDDPELAGLVYACAAEKYHGQFVPLT